MARELLQKLEIGEAQADGLDARKNLVRSGAGGWVWLGLDASGRRHAGVGDEQVQASAGARGANRQAARTGVGNFTQRLAVHMALEYSPRIRVNAIAPGFFLTMRNQYLLTDRGTGELTARGRSIIEHTPMKRVGEPRDLLGAVLWLLSPLS